MWRRGGAVAASVLLGVGCMLVAAHPAAAVTGSFTIAGGRTRWSFDSGKAITITGTTNTPDPGPVTALVDGDSTGSGTADSTGAFSLTFTLPDTTCADGEANTHQVGVSFSDGATLPSQQIIYRCANYTAQPEFDGNATTYQELINIDRAGVSPYVTTCILATDRNNGDPLGHVVETGAPPTTLSVTALYNATNQTPQPEVLTWAGATATAADAPGCYLYNLPSPAPFTNPFTPYTIGLTANLVASTGVTGKQTAGPTASVLGEQLGANCPVSGQAVTVTGLGFGSENTIDLVYSYEAFVGPKIRRVFHPDAAGGTPPPAGDTVTSTDDGHITDNKYVVPGQGTVTVSAYLVLADGSGVLLPSTVTFASGATNGQTVVACNQNQPKALTLTPDIYATIPGTIPAPGYRYLTVSVRDLTPSSTLSATVNSATALFVDGNRNPTVATTSGKGNYTGTLEIPSSAVSCQQANIVTVDSANTNTQVGGFGNEASTQEPLYLTCPSIADAAAAHPAAPGDVTTPVLTGFDTVVSPTDSLSAVISTGPDATGTYQPVTGTSAQQTFLLYESSRTLSFPTAPLTCGSVDEIHAQQYASPTDFTTPPSATLPLVSLCDGDPTLTASPASYAYSTGSRTLTLAGTGLRPGSKQQVSIDGTAVGGTVTANPNGTIAVAEPAAGLSCGPHTVTATNTTAIGAVSSTTPNDDLPATAVINVTCPSATITPGTINDDDQPENLAVGGQGFDPGSAVTVTLPNGQSKSADIGKDGTLMTANGTLSSGILPCGAGVATVTEKGQAVTPQPSAQAAYVVNCPSPPSLTVTPSTIAGTTGQRTLSIAGTGWLPNSTQPVTYDGNPLTTATVDGSGDFTVTTTLTDPTPAAHAVAAVQGRYRSASTLLRVTAPAITLTPAAFSKDAAPASVTVAGAGYDPGYALDLAVPGLADIAVVADSTGAFSTAVPSAGIACGTSQTVAATEPVAAGAPFTVGPTATASLSVTCPAMPTLTPTPGVFAFTPGGRNVTFTGVGFRAGIPVTVSGDGIPTQTVTTDPGGNLTVTLPATGACGSHSVLATPSVGYATSSTYVVTCPALVANPSALDGLHLPDTIALAGVGYDPNSLVTLVMAQPNLPPTNQAVTTDATGAFAIAFPVAGLYCAPAPVTGTESYPSSPPPTAGVLVTVSCPKPVLTVTPKTISDGVVAVYSGRNFHPGENVDLVWKLPDGTLGLGDCQTTVADDTTISGGCLVFPHDVLGVRTLVATDDKDAIGRAPVLVQQNPDEPGRDDDSGSGLSLLSRR